MAAPMTGMVQQIERLARQDAGVGVGSVGGSAVGGTTASGSSAYDQVYRVTVRLDDGTTRVMTQEMAPTFSAGDRIRIANGMIQRY